MKELLRVSMNEKQVRQACEDWARSRSRADGAAATVVLVPDGPDGPNPLVESITAEVIFTKRRERKTKAAVPD